MSLRILFLFLFGIFYFADGFGQACNNWLRTNNAFESVTIGDLDVSGNKITVEALITRTAPWSGGYNYAGDIVSKHDLPNNVNYLLRPNNAEITTSNGYFTTPPVCPIELNKTYHVAMVYDGAALKFYRNGFLLSQVAVQGNMVNNNFLTTIGDYAYPNPVGTNFVGYINEVRIWNVARTQDEIRNSMTGPLPNPALQTGLQAYYTFDNLLNKQGNVAWNGTLNNAASINNTNPNCLNFGANCFTSTTLILSSDTTICAGDSAFIRTGTDLLEVSWLPPNFLNDPSSSNPIATPPQSTTYQLTAVTYGPNLVVNSDFSQGNTGFFSSYSYNSSGVAAGVYYVGTNSQAWHPAMPSCNDHTSGNGNMLLVNGAQTLNEIVWSQTVSVTPNTNYAFSTWIQNITTVNPATLQFSINGVNLGTPFTANTQFCLWERFHTIWNSGSNTTANISIVNRNQIFSGNDFALDDIYFSQALTRTDSIRINVNRPEVQTIEDTTICVGNAVALATTGASSYSWSPAIFLNNPSAAAPLATPNTSMMYYVTGTDDAGCEAKDSVHVVVEQAPQLNSISDTSICQGTILPLTTTTNASTVSWEPATSVSNPGISSPVYTGPGNQQLIVTATSAAGCVKKDTVFISLRPAYNISETRSFCASQLPFTWNGINVSSGGAYVANLVSTSGCDSIVTLQLNITDTIRSSASHRICDNQGPYSWNGLQLTASGTYSVPLTAISGCDSLATLNFTVNNATFSTTASSVCQGDLPFLWNGRTFNAAGSYQAVLTNLAGCDSTANLNLVILPSANSVLNRHICESDAPFLWNGQTLTGSGQFNTTLTAANGCDSLATLNLTVNPTLRSETRVDICRNAAPYLWNGQSYSTPGSHFVNLLSSTGCDSIATLVLSINDNAATNIRRQICTAQLPYSWNGITINGTGTFTANLNTIAGCDSVVTLDLEVAPNLTSNIASAVCNSAFPYVWNGLTIGAPGNYTATLRASSGCDSLVTVTVSTLAVQPVQTTPTVTRCEGTNLVLNATPGYAAYHWSPGNLVTDSTIMNPGYTGTGALQQLIVRAVDNNGCTTSDTTVITSRPNPVVRTIADSSLCRAQQITLLATGAAAYNWSPFTQLNNSTSAAPLLTANISQTIYVTGTDNFGCMGRDTVNITVRSADDLVAPTGGAVCSRSNITLHGANGSAYNYSWSPSSTLNNANVENPLATPVASTIYSVRITDTLCNYYKDFQVPVTVRPLPEVIAQKSNDISCARRSALLTASGANVFQWQSHPTLSNFSGATATARPTVSTIYTVTGTDANGCKNSDTVKINVLPGKEVYNIPNAFTPNGDGLNDCFGIKHWGDATDVTFRIYNRYGQLVFETSDVNECWNGKFKGKAADAGNYVFIAMANSACGKMEKKGNVLLIR